MAYLFVHFREKETPDGKWCMMIDYYGVPGEGQGYVPFICADITNS